VDKKPQKLDVGKDAVVIGHVSGAVGDGSVVIGATDERGNTIINQPMAVGRGAQAGPGSIAIGAGACAGVSLPVLAVHLTDLVTAMNERDDRAAHQDSISHVAQAAEAATKNDEPTVLYHLKAAGRWAFDFASGVGSSLVANAIWKAMGM